ncbi:MAG: hypothetical protein Tsb0015_05120 [Simkaniaceae bacterium]
MQIKALEGSHFISANTAQRQKDYLCPECLQTVRLRKGPHRKPHFYHWNPTDQCYQSKKTMAHLQTQYYLEALFPQEIFLEYPFKDIGRIADAYLPKHHIVFEVQCSFISLKEVKRRNFDYSRLGIKVVWILHDRKYNRRKVSSAEDFLRKYPSYFTNMNDRGEGIIYDQFEIIYRGIRMYRSRRFPVHLLCCRKKKYWQKYLTWRAFQNKSVLYFSNDRSDLWLNKKLIRNQMKNAKRNIFFKKVKSQSLFFLNLYKNLLDFWLRKCS